MGKINVVIFGCRKITIDAINYILNYSIDRCNISGVVTHDAERDRVYYNTLVSEHCELLGIPWTRFDGRINKNEIDAFKPDLIFSLYYRKILKQNILDIPPRGCINIHPGLLPEGRGPAPSLWNVLNGDEYAGSTMHYMVRDVDAGDVIDQRKVKINGMSGFDLNVYLMEKGIELFKDNLYDIINGTNKRIPQNHDDAVYCLPFQKSLRYIFWDNPDRVLNQLRAFAKPFDGALTWTSKGAKIVVWEAEKLAKRISFDAPGFFEVIDGQIVVQTGTLPILIKSWEIIDGEIKNKGRFISGPPVA